MNDVIFVQFFPINKRLGRYAVASKDCNEFKEKFLEEVRAADADHQSIFMILKNDFDTRPNHILERCIHLFYMTYK